MTTVDPSALPRSRLVRKVLGTPAGGLCLITAPLGYGASTLMALAAAGTTDRTVWLGLPSSDVDPAWFWRRIEDGLAERGPAEPHGPPDDPSSEHALHRLENHAATVRLVIDDLDGERHTALLPEVQYLVDHLPRTATAVVRTVNAPRLDVSRLLHSGRLVLLDQSDLSLSTAEAEDLVTRAAPDVRADRLDALVRLADGWVGALNAAIFGAGREPDDDPAAWLMTQGIDLLFRPEMERLTDEQRDFLVTTSVLDELSAEGCDAVRGRHDSARLLAELELAHTHLRRPDPARPGFRLHGLFAEFLRRQLALRGRQREAAAQRAASRWLASIGATEQAIDRLVNAGDTTEALHLLEHHVGELLDSGRAAAVRRWYGAAPTSLVTEHHLHLLGAAWAEILDGRVGAAEEQVRLLGEALTALGAGPPDASTEADTSGSGPLTVSPAWLWTETELARAYLDWWHGYPGRMIARLARIQPHLGTGWSRTGQQAAAINTLRGLVWLGRTSEAKRQVTALAERPRTLAAYREVHIPGMRALVSVQEGRVRRGLHLADGALDALDRRGWVGVLDDCDARLARGLALLDLDRLDDAEREAAEVVDRAAASISLETGQPQVALRLLGRLPQDVDTTLLRLRAQGVRRADQVTQLRALRPESDRQAIEMRLLLTAVLVRTRPAEAERTLLVTGAAAADLGLLRALVGVPDEVLVLAERLAPQDDTGVLDRLLAATQARTAAPPVTAPARRLTRGEQHLLALLPQHAGNVELAKELGVSVNTVKTRLRRLYAKLGVHTRQAAIDRAAALPSARPAAPRLDRS